MFLKPKFALLFKKYRLRSEIESLNKLGSLLAEEGLVYESSIFSRWQKGQRVPKKRAVLLQIIKLFVKKRGISSLKEANQFLESANHGYLTKTEKIDIQNAKNSEATYSKQL